MLRCSWQQAMTGADSKSQASNSILHGDSTSYFLFQSVIESEVLFSYWQPEYFLECFVILEDSWFGFISSLTPFQHSALYLSWFQSLLYQLDCSPEANLA